MLAYMQTDAIYILQSYSCKKHGLVFRNHIMLLIQYCTTHKLLRILIIIQFAFM